MIRRGVWIMVFVAICICFASTTRWIKHSPAILALFVFLSMMFKEYGAYGTPVFLADHSPIVNAVVGVMGRRGGVPAGCCITKNGEDLVVVWGKVE
jgi:hypothetical protein